MKKITALLTALLLTIAAMVTMVAAEEQTITVTLIVEGVSENFCNKTFTTTNTNLADFIQEVDTLEDSLTFTITDTGYGPYVQAVNGDVEASHGDWSGWMFTVNGVSLSVGMGATDISDGDVILLYFSDQYGVGFQFPEFDFTELSTGKVKVTSKDADFSGNITVNPVAGATVKWAVTATDIREYTTDENGVFTVESNALTAGTHKVSISKYDSNGTPLVLRTTADATVDVETGDSSVAYVWVLAILASMTVFFTVRKKAVND